jgi:hypothetical protein
MSPHSMAGGRGSFPDLCDSILFACLI